MYSISNSYKNHIENDLSFSPKSKIVVDGIEYLGDVIKTTPVISHSNTKMIGGFPAKTCKFEIYDFNNELDLVDKEIIVYRGLFIDGATEFVPQGIFIPKADNITTNISQRTISLDNVQDKTQLFDVKYESNLDWSTRHTGLEIVQEICNKLGVVLENENFNFSSYNFLQPNFSENTTCREVISRLAEIGGSIAFINRNGNLVIKQQTFTEHQVQRDRYNKLSKENSFTINTVVLGKDGIDDDIVFPYTMEEDRVEWKILDNPFVDLYREEMIEEVSQYIIGKSIIPFEMNEFIDGFYLDLNDTVSIIDKNGITFTGVILNYESTGRIKAKIGADVQTGTQTNYNIAGSNKQSLNRVKQEVDHVNQRITSLAENVDEQNEKISQVTQTVDEINSKVSDIADLTTTINTNIGFISIEKVNTSEPLYIEIHPIYEHISYLYPNLELYPSDILYSKVRTLRFKNLDTNEIIDYELPCDLWYHDNKHYDTFILDYNTKTVRVEKNIGIDENGETYVLTKPAINTYEYPTINLTNGDYEISLLGYKNAYISIRVMVQNEYTTHFATKAELNSSITQTRDSIQLQVDEKLDGEDFTKASIIAKINDETSSVQIDADNISLEGKQIDLTGDSITINSDKFSVDKEGNITATSGNIGGYTINSDKLFVYVKDPYTYNSDDIEIIKNILINMETPTPEQLEKYDIDGDGLINSFDLLQVQSKALGYTSTEGTFEITSSDTRNVINTTGNAYGTTTKIGLERIITNTINSNYITANNNVTTEDLIINGTLSNNSDKRLKKDIEQMSENYINIIQELSPVTFSYIKNNTRHIGFIAQEMEQVFNNNKMETIPIKKDELGFYSIDYISLIGILWKGNQCLYNNLEKLIEKVEILENKLKEGN